MACATNCSATMLFRDADSSSAGFTLAEVLAALALLAIVVPVALEAVSLASRAGSLGQRKAAAARVAERVLSEYTSTGRTETGSETGRAAEAGLTYAWRLERTPWAADPLEEVTVHVTFDVQGEARSLSLSTLVDPTRTAATPSVATAAP
jgi:type II secretion system protein I